MGNRKSKAGLGSKVVRRLGIALLAVLLFLSGAACAFLFAYYQPFCKINIVAPPFIQPKYHALEDSGEMGTDR